MNTENRRTPFSEAFPSKEGHISARLHGISALAGLLFATALAALIGFAQTTPEDVPVAEAHWVWGSDSETALTDAGGGGHDAHILSPDHVSVIQDPVSGLSTVVFDGIVDPDDDAPHGQVVSDTMPASETGFSASALIFSSGGQVAYAPILSRLSDPAAWNDGFAIYIGPEGTVCAYVGDFSAAGSRLDSGVAPKSGAWNHVALSYDGTEAVLYVDGVETASASIPAATQIEGPVALGSLVASGVTRPWNGAIADVRLRLEPLEESAFATMASDALTAYTTSPAELDTAAEPSSSEPAQLAIEQLPDSDGDGVPDEEEIRLGRDPFSPGAVVPQVRILEVHTPME